VITQVETPYIKGVSIALYEDGSAVVFLSTSGDVVTCSSDKVEMWLDTGEGELAEMLAHLGWQSDRVHVC
jgi:hypothetical protein